VRASLVIFHNPFDSHRDRDLIEIKRRTRIGTLARRRGLVDGNFRSLKPVICLHNGAPVLRARWKRTVVEDGDLVAFVTLPQGGGGGASKVFAAIALIVIAIFAPYAAAAIVGATSGVAFTAVTIGITLLGAALVNALLPPPRTTSAQQSSDLAAASPTYSISAQGNQVALGSPIPVQYGRHLLYPSFAAQPYLEFVGNEQYLYELFCLGQGSFEVESINIEDTPIASFPDITTELIEPDGTVTLFPTNVITSVEVSGQEALTGTAVGPFSATAAGTVANAIAIDVVLSRGLYYAADDGSLAARSINWNVEARQIDNAGAPLGGWITLGAESFSAATNTPQRLSYRYDLAAPGRYQVKVTRTNPKDDSTRVGNDLNWVGLRSYIPGSQQYGNVTLLAMRMRASNSLSESTSRKINVIQTRKLPTWSPSTGWSAATATRSIAWAFADAARAGYGGKQVDARIDLRALYQLNQIWSARGDTFDGVFDSRITLWEALTVIARAGRAKPFVQGGIVCIARDQAAILPTAMFTMRNVVRGSMQVEYIMPTDDQADSVVIEFFDEQSWSWQTVECVLPGGTNDRPAKARLMGVTQHAQAWREGMFIAACNARRRINMSWSTELEGHIPSPIDLTVVSHDVLLSSVCGDVLSASGLNGSGGIDAGGTIGLSEPVTVTADAKYIAFRKRNGSMSGPWLVGAGADDHQVILVETITNFQPYLGGDAEPSHFAFGSIDTIYQRARIGGIQPRGDTVQLTAIAEDDYVHTVDGAPPPDANPSWALPPIPTIPYITGAIAAAAGGGVDAPTLSISWTPANGASSYIIEWSEDGVAWTRLAEISKTDFTFSTKPGYQYVRVAPVGKAVGPWVVWSGTVAGGIYVVTPTAPTGLTAAAFQTTIVLTWPLVTQLNVEHIEILRNTWNDTTTATVIAALPPNSTRYSDTIGVSGVSRYYWIRLVNTKGVAGPVSNTANATTGSVGDIAVVDALPVTGLFEGRIVYLTSDKKIYRWNGTAWTSAVSAADIQGMLAQGQIPPQPFSSLTGYLGSDQIQANTVFARHLILADTTNLLPDPYFYDAVWWGFSGRSGFVPANATPGAQPVRRFLRITSDAGIFAFGSSFTGIEQGGDYRVRVRCFISADFSGRFGALVHFPGTALATGGVPTFSGDADMPWPQWNFASPQLPRSEWLSFAAIQGATTLLSTQIQVLLEGAISAGYIELALEVQRANSSDLVVDGSIVTSKIAAGAVTTPLLQAGAVTADKLDVGQLSAISADVGVLTAGHIVSGGGAVQLNLDATGTQPVLLAPRFMLRADGNAYFGGLLTADAISAVNTINIAGNAVTVPIHVQASDPLLFGTGNLGEWVILLEDTVDYGLDLPSIVSFSAIVGLVPQNSGSANTFVVRITRDRFAGVGPTHQGASPGVTIGEYAYSVPGGYATTLPIAGADTPSAGLHTYTFWLQMAQGNTTYNAVGRSMTMIGAKK
jgi:sulfur carrier protein ThiS